MNFSTSGNICFLQLLLVWTGWPKLCNKQSFTLYCCLSGPIFRPLFHWPLKAMCCDFNMFIFSLVTMCCAQGHLGPGTQGCTVHQGEREAKKNDGPSFLTRCKCYLLTDAPGCMKARPDMQRSFMDVEMDIWSFWGSSFWSIFPCRIQTTSLTRKLSCTKCHWFSN